MTTIIDICAAAYHAAMELDLDVPKLTLTFKTERDMRVFEQEVYRAMDPFMRWRGSISPEQWNVHGVEVEIKHRRAERPTHPSPPVMKPAKP